VASRPPDKRPLKLQGLARLRTDENTINQTYEAVERESDRGAALILTAELEHVLERSIAAQLIDLEPNEHEELFSPSRNAPLASFGAKIRLGYALSVYGTVTRNDLATIAQIRNIFAHSPMDVGFSHDTIAAACFNLSAQQTYMDQGLAKKRMLPSVARDRFIVNCLAILIGLEAHGMVRPTQKRARLLLAGVKIVNDEAPATVEEVTALATRGASVALP
jgi:hypothetical protein